MDFEKNIEYNDIKLFVKGDVENPEHFGGYPGGYSIEEIYLENSEVNIINLISTITVVDMQNSL